MEEMVVEKAKEGMKELLGFVLAGIGVGATVGFIGGYTIRGKKDDRKELEMNEAFEDAVFDENDEDNVKVTDED